MAAITDDRIGRMTSDDMIESVKKLLGMMNEDDARRLGKELANEASPTGAEEAAAWLLDSANNPAEPDAIAGPVSAVLSALTQFS